MADDTPKGWFSEADLPLAKETKIVKVERAGVQVDVKVIEGTRVPPDLIQPYMSAGGSAEGATELAEPGILDSSHSTADETEATPSRRARRSAAAE